MIKTLLAATAIAASTLLAGGASAAPLSVTSAAVAGTDRLVSDTQYRTRTVTRTTRVVRPARQCTVRTVRTRTPRGTVVRRVRTCR
jgi:hypothetical protein